MANIKRSGGRVKQMTQQSKRFVSLPNNNTITRDMIQDNVVNNDKLAPDLKRYATTERSDKDAQGVFVTIEWFDDQAIPALRKKSVLSGGTSPKYTTRTVTFYDESELLIKTLVYTLTYDVDDELLKEELQ